MAAMMHAAFQAKHVCQECVNAERLLRAQGSLLDRIATQQIMFANVLRQWLLVVEQLTPVPAVNANAVQMLRVANHATNNTIVHIHTLLGKGPACARVEEHLREAKVLGKMMRA